MKGDTIESVVDGHLCTGCGTCVTICPRRAVSMRETAAGLLVATIDHAACNRCGLCAEVCSGSHLSTGLVSEFADPFTGDCVAAYVGFATDHQIRQSGQSGGVVTALLQYLIDSGRIDRAVVTEMPEDGSLRPQAKVASDHQVIGQSQGSKYCPVAVNAALKETNATQERIAVVGLPCHLHGIRNLQVCNKRWQDRVSITIGLFCDRTLSYSAIDYLANSADLQRSEVTSIVFRDRSRYGWPGEVKLITNEGDMRYLPSAIRMEIKDIFTPIHCRLCFDKLNVLCDIAMGDAYGVRESPKGFSVLIARTRLGQEVVEAAQLAGVLCLEKTDPRLIFQGQGLELRRKQWACYAGLWRQKAYRLPEFGIDDMSIPKTLARIMHVERKSPTPRHIFGRLSKYSSLPVE